TSRTTRRSSPADEAAGPRQTPRRDPRAPRRTRPRGPPALVDSGPVNDLTDPAGIAALAAGGVALLALIVAVVAVVRMRRLRAARGHGLQGSSATSGVRAARGPPAARIGSRRPEPLEWWSCPGAQRDVRADQRLHRAPRDGARAQGEGRGHRDRPQRPALGAR